MEIRSITEKLEAMGHKALSELDSLCIDAPKSNRDLLLKIVNDNKDTEFGKAHHFSEIKSEEDYRKFVPISEFNDYAEYISRMENKEKNILSVYPFALFSHSSGSTGVPKSIPTSQKSIDIFSSFMVPRFFALCKKAGRPIKGRGLCCIEVVDKTENGSLYSNISGAGIREIDEDISKLNVLPYEITHPKGFMPVMYLKLRYALEERDLAFISGIFMAYFADMMDYLEHHWREFVEDIRYGKCRCADFVFAPNPQRADELQAEFEKGFDLPIMPRIWKNLSAISAVGTGGFAEYTERMRRYLGDIPVDFLAYAASEALMGSPTKLEQEGCTLQLCSCYYEFLEKDTEKIVSFESLEIGKKYEIIITNLSGFYRYRLNDIVKVVGFDKTCPIVNFCYRKNQLLDIVGDKITTEMLNSIMEQFKTKLQVDITAFEVYVNRQISPSRYEFLIETSPELSLNKTEEYAKILDECICSTNQVYCECKKTDEIAPVKLYLQEKDIQLKWNEHKNNGVANIQQKPVILLNTKEKKDFFYSHIKND